MNIFEVKTRLPNSSLFNQPSRRSPITSIRQPRSSSLSASKNDFLFGTVRTNIPVRHIELENSKPTNFSYFTHRSTPPSPLPTLRIPDNTGKYIARIVSNSTGRPTLVSSSASYFQPMDSNEDIPNVTTILPVYYQRDSLDGTLPSIRKSSTSSSSSSLSLKNNISTASSGVGSANSFLNSQNSIPVHNNNKITKIYSKGLTSREPSPYRIQTQQYSTPEPKKSVYIGKLFFNDTGKNDSYRTSSSLVNVNRDSSASLNNLNKNSSSASLNSQSNTPTKSILVNRKKFANPPSHLTSASPSLQKKTVTFAN
ncbi:unnamed protein product [Brachionus calyciflorus]|uniref:Uncharacterized protein n=1 Tax=Brachionus calyciflorus TaxID=104777 RepID=A0A814HW14_9BILA|nr:unnamed protein product [Brachionus calyciflorus]